MFPRNVDIGFFCEIRETTVRNTQAKRQLDERPQHCDDSSVDRTFLGSGQCSDTLGLKRLHLLNNDNFDYHSRDLTLCSDGL